ncbi:Ras superfamily GTP-binding protein YlqF [Pelagirhabdus alkalitolerans]|uniref:Ribosome biogenesis GTPase A n=1 Tax=Pelagirhabdus alkalitolerans TaxID=1612202 RepID=A0A1G6H2T1_9BACI|nr:ribosome biogenesis GTPase YlqF [Pelagirhabdus alkalitolerans]SDB88454.1 Ras superfamily GTP-binding protein YlqF [Pelagirhabdus alkalitolerans]
MSIQWFPGHMAKAKREVQEKLKLVDFVIELVDARAPISSTNPMLNDVLQQKPKMQVLMKKDLADSSQTKKWISHLQSQGIKGIAVNVNDKSDIKSVVDLAKEMGAAKMEKLKKKGIRPRPARAMIIGVPNVGKSTLINRLANRKITKVGDKPGVTTAQQWIKIKKDFELLDTPGILWPKFEDEAVGYRLAALGMIKDQLLTIEEIAMYVLDILKEHYPNLLVERYQLQSNDMSTVDLFEQIGRLRGAIASGNTIDQVKTAELIIRDFRSGKIGPVTIEFPN